MRLYSILDLGPNTRSLRATVPEGIVAFLDLQAGEKLDWKMETMNGERVVIVKKAPELEHQIHHD